MTRSRNPQLVLSATRSSISSITSAVFTLDPAHPQKLSNRNLRSVYSDEEVAHAVVTLALQK
jgi:hypothetical protein